MGGRGGKRDLRAVLLRRSGPTSPEVKRPGQSFWYQTIRPERYVIIVLTKGPDGSVLAAISDKGSYRWNELAFPRVYMPTGKRGGEVHAIAVNMALLHILLRGPGSKKASCFLQQQQGMTRLGSGWVDEPPIFHPSQRNRYFFGY